MRHTPKQYAQALYLAISESAAADQDKILDNFVNVLRENLDIGALPEIEQEYYKLDREGRGIKIAEVATASKLSTEDEKELVKKLNDYVSGQVELKKSIDQGLVGGIVVKIGDELIDGSVKKKILNLKDKLRQ